MNSDDYMLEGCSSECKPLMDACTLSVYRHNAFRITGLFADASVRDIKRRVDDLKHAEELGDAESEHAHAFALNPPPDLEHIREAAQKLQDPERRIIEEFFWFWPLKWGNSKHDPAILALANGDRQLACDSWTQGLSGDDAIARIVSKHNLAVLYQLVALDGELLCLDQNLNEESLAKVEKWWRRCFGFWEELAEEDEFWRLVTDRIRSLDDPRLTTGIVRRMRATLPEAMDKINALLAVHYIEKGKLVLARKHIAYMKETHQGLDDVTKTLSLITKPLQARIRDAVEKATSNAERQPERAFQTASDLFNSVSQPLKIIRNILPQDDHNRIDLCDAVADAALNCHLALARDQQDWKRCLLILNQAQRCAESQELRDQIGEHSVLTEAASLLGPIAQLCESVLSVAAEKPENAVLEAQRLLASVKPLLAGLQSSNASDDVKNQAKDGVARTLMQCAVLFGNETETWDPCVQLLETSLKLAVASELKDQIATNLQVVRRNASVYDNLAPISSAPSLSTTNGFGFTLYGATDHDAETGSFLSTYYFVALAIPVFPIRRYRVIPTDRGYRFLGAAPLRTFDKWHLAISLGIIVAFVFLAVTGGHSDSSYQSTPASPSRVGSALSPPGSSADGSALSGVVTDDKVSSDFRQTPPSTVDRASPLSTFPDRSMPSRSTLANEIESGKRRAEELETQIAEMDRQLEDYESRMKSYRAAGKTDQYNSLVSPYNSLVTKRNVIYGQYSRLIDEINAKVTRYNSGAR